MFYSPNNVKKNGLLGGLFYSPILGSVLRREHGYQVFQSELRSPVHKLTTEFWEITLIYAGYRKCLLWESVHRYNLNYTLFSLLWNKNKTIVNCNLKFRRIWIWDSRVKDTLIIIPTMKEYIAAVISLR